MKDAVKYFFRKPDSSSFDRLISQRMDSGCTYDAVASTRSWELDWFGELPTSRVVGPDLWLLRRASIGYGNVQYRLAIDWIRRGKCFNLGWVSCHQQRRFHEGDPFALAASVWPFWVVNFCRVIYVEEELREDASIFSIGIGTLPCHAASGEERISIQHHHESDQVDLLIGSFSRPQGIISRVFLRYLRSQQKRFAEQAIEKMRREVGQFYKES